MVREENNILWKHTDDTTSKPFVANSAYAFFRDRDMSASRFVVIRQSFADQKPGLSLDVLHFLQIRNNASLVHNGTSSSDATAEVELEFLDGNALGDQVESGFSRQARAVLGHDLQCRAVLCFVAIRG